MAITYLKLISSDIKPFLEELAKLRIKVFREFPYLYEGSLEYERKYLNRYISASDSLVVIAMDQDKVVGASTCLPLNQESDEFKQPIIENGINTNNSFYFGESIVLQKYRGRGIGKRFFKFREHHAKSTFPNLHITCFCAVERISHPLEPSNYKPLDNFWIRLGYEKEERIFAHYAWKDINKNEEDKKKLIFWIKKWK